MASECGHDGSSTVLLYSDLQFVRLDIKTVVQHNRQHERGVMVAKATGLLQQPNNVVLCVKQAFRLLYTDTLSRRTDLMNLDTTAAQTSKLPQQQYLMQRILLFRKPISGGATPGVRSNDLAGSYTALALPAYCFALLR